MSLDNVVDHCLAIELQETIRLRHGGRLFGEKLQRTYPTVATGGIDFDEFGVVPVLVARGIDSEVAPGALLLLVWHLALRTTPNTTPKRQILICAWIPRRT
jgi:hypothetical protein